MVLILSSDRMISRGVNFTSRFRGVLKDYKLVFATFDSGSFANIKPCKGQHVEGAVYETDSSVTALDEFEHFPVHYLKHEINVENELGLLKCLVYIANPKSIQGSSWPTREYMSHLLKDNDLLSKEYLEELKKIKTSN